MYEFSINKLKQAQIKIRNKDSFHVNNNNYKEYERFVTKSLSIITRKKED